uniref:Candidate secreted effector n=1 Tax=Meloidogyne incognita TaxID=6306 RepID=A0A914MRZ0_MELIC
MLNERWWMLLWSLLLRSPKLKLEVKRCLKHIRWHSIHNSRLVLRLLTRQKASRPSSWTSLLTLKPRTKTVWMENMIASKIMSCSQWEKVIHCINCTSGENNVINCFAE